MNRVMARTFSTSTVLTVGTGAEVTEAKPLRTMPTWVTKKDIVEYGNILNPLVLSLSEDIRNTVVKFDPNAEHDAADKLLYQAYKLDGCKGPSGCPGWGKPDEDPVAPEPVGLGEDVLEAYKLRLKAFEHKVNAASAEEAIVKRCGSQYCMKKAQIAAEVAYFKEWRYYIDKSKKYWQHITDTVTVWGEDFQQLQSLDLEYQKFRRQYTELTGKQPSRAMPLAAPDAPGLPWGWILGLATVGAAGYWLFGLGGAAVLAGLISRRPARAG